jgi:hypothetical protein
LGTALRLWRSPCVWLVQRVVAEAMSAVLDKQDDIKVAADMTASV